MQNTNNINNVIIFGRNGQLAHSIRNYYTSKIAQFSHINNFTFTQFSSSDADFNNILLLENFLNNIKNIPLAIINTTAFTNVDLAETQQEKCNNINHLAVLTLAKYCHKNNILLIHYSTDYVFDGSGDQPFSEDNQNNLKPLNYYGITKLLGEKAIINSGCRYLIFRVSWLYDDRPDSKNFVNTITRLAKINKTLKIVDDQIGSPTHVDFVSLKTFEIFDNLQKKQLIYQENNCQIDNLKTNKNIDKIFPSGVYHLNNQNFCSWFDFACQIVAKLKNDFTFSGSQDQIITEEILPIKSTEYNFIAKRPLNSRLSCNNLHLLLT